MWLSIRPGISRRPFASITVASGAAMCASASEPTAGNLPSRITTASAEGFCRSSVVILALTMIRSFLDIVVLLAGAAFAFVTDQGSGPGRDPTKRQAGNPRPDRD